MGVSEAGQHPAGLPNCMVCIHYKVSWDPAFPHSCAVFSIKTRLMPSLEVFRSVGGNCPSFRQRKG
ncbi:MAG: hypothetical protein LBI06_00905 [Treponema sp.]|nr:hypothetical protein [Treponema sp.]